MPRRLSIDKMGIVIDSISEDLFLEIDGITKRRARSLLSALVRETPVDTGKARTNWQVTLGAPARTVLPAADKGGRAAISLGTALINSIPVRSEAEINISNPVPYMGELNAGKSKQAPAGWIERTANRVLGNPSAGLGLL